jgi:hypothetical protein
VVVGVSVTVGRLLNLNSGCVGGREGCNLDPCRWYARCGKLFIKGFFYHGFERKKMLDG